MSRVGGFSEETVRILAERAHHHCSNPDCGVQTVMPIKGSKKTVRVGEAAHIYALGKDVPRYREDLSPKDLADVTNGIWLCRVCHAKIDKSGDIYSADLLFKWKSEHEDCVRAGFKDRRNFRQMVGSELDARMPEASSRARQIARDMPYAWEYKLTAELLFDYARALERRSNDLRNGNYTLRGNFIHPDHYFEWFVSKMTEVMGVAQSEGRLINVELPLAWGAQGVPGDKYLIYDTCVKIRDAFERQIEFEEDILFSYTDESFSQIRECMRGFSYNNMSKLFDVSKRMRDVFDGEQLEGEHRFEFVIDVHDGFSNIIDIAKQCMGNYLLSRV